MTLTLLSMADSTIVTSANLANILIAALMIARVKWPGAEYTLGLAIIALGLPTLAVVILNYLNNREMWYIILPLFFVFYCGVEFLFDYVLRMDFRSTALLWPYLLLFYAGLMGFIGYAFLVTRLYGFITLSTYFLNLFATAWSYSQVGHGS